MGRVTWVIAALALGCGRFGFDHGADVKDVVVPDAVCSEGLVGYWSFDTSSSTIVRDVSGNGQDGTIVGAPIPTAAPGRVGDALAYSATGNAYVRIPALPLDTTPGAAVTVTTWFWRDDQNVDDALFYMPAAPKYDVWLTREPRCPGLCLCVNDGNGACWGVLDSTLVGRWVHLAAILRNGALASSELFIDGQPRTATCLFGVCTAPRTVAAPFDLGASDSYEWHGMFDETRVHRRALSPAEIATLYTDACAR
jgi:hypothetical protein